MSFPSRLAAVRGPFRSRLSARGSVIALLVLLPILARFEARGSGWSFRNGDDLGGAPHAFHFHEKSVTVNSQLSGKSREIPTKDLSLRSRQRLLFSSLFYQNHPDGALALTKNGGTLLIAVTLTAAGSFLGFLIAAWLVAGKRNPLLALVSVFGSWVVILIFLICYYFLQLRYGGGFATHLVGIGFAATLTPLFVAGVYGCTYGKGLLIFHSHFLAGLCCVGAGLMFFEIFAGNEKADDWWTRKVFAPLGMSLLLPGPKVPTGLEDAEGRTGKEASPLPLRHKMIADGARN